MRKLFFLIVCLAAMAPLGAAQSNLALIRGSVLDPQSHVVPNAHIHITAKDTGAQREVTSNASGLYEIAGLLPGSYQVSVDATGFRQTEQTIDLEVGQQATIDVRLGLGGESQTVTVQASQGELLKTQDSSVGATVDQRSVDSLPLNGRMMIDLVLTVPGAHISHGAGTGDMNPLYWRPGQRSAVSIGGSRPNANYFLLDGATNTDPTFNTQNISASPDAVQEFQVQTGSYSAEMGGAGGGQINIVTRSGTGTWHGTAYEFLRNGAMDASTFNSMGNNFLVQNNFGGSIGGPLPHLGKTFIFVNYEGLRHVETMAMVDTVPTEEEVGGDFSQSGVDIYDPNTTRDNPDFNPGLPASKSNPKVIRDQFQYRGVLNVIPPDRLQQAPSIMLQKYTPRPNTMDMGSMTMMGQPTVIGAGNDANNYLDLRKQRMNTDQGTIRVDHNFGNNDSAYFRYSAGGEYGFHPVGLPGFGFYHDDLAQNGILAWTHVFNSHMVNTFSGAISRLVMMHSTESAYKNDIVTELGLHGTGFGGPGAWGAPYFTVQGFSPMGDQFSATPMHAWDTVVEGRDSLSWQLGRHSLKFGGAYQKFIWPMWGFFQNRGFYQFTNGFTTKYALNDGKTGASLASFLLGLPAARQGQAGVPQMDLRQWYANGYGQDSWRLSSTTTLTYGLRYEYMAPLVDIEYTNSNLDLSGPDPHIFIGGQNGYPKGLMYAPRTNFAPRLGLAQNFPSVGLVAHVAYGIFYTPVDMNTWCNQRHNVPYVFPLTSQSDPFIPSIVGVPTPLDFPDPVLGKSVVSFTGMQLHAPAQYIQQWSASVEKQLGKETTLELGYLGSGGFHLQRSHLINNAEPGPGLIQPRRHYYVNNGPGFSFVPNSTFPPTVKLSPTFDGHVPVSTVNLLENTAQSWYDAGYVNVRRRYSNGLSFLANYTWAKALTNAPDFRSPMFESAIPQNNDDLQAEKGPGCDVRHRGAISAVYSPHAWNRNNFTHALTKDWRTSIVYQVQTGFPLTISVFGDTANAGTVVGENPIRANYTGKPIFTSGTKNSTTWFNPAAFATPPAYTYGNVGRNTVYGPGTTTTDFGVVREFSIAEKARFEGRAEFFNLFNHTNLGTPNRFVNTASFGSITEASTPGREIQLSARLSF
ncbi:TonB-dependent receptor [Occallatibacter riparius]|uniref:TonB-dependent receptor n=1 Tax=Occallatibacter riparius TaxID=1002689 RepID=A0A9J7BR36_9BACT|nr:TonB-dependent receptor [Occallatibacter riparius]UWZ84210.1 TonB-dependent receptor [Occallatibacter riparius]